VLNRTCATVDCRTYTITSLDRCKLLIFAVGFTARLPAAAQQRLDHVRHRHHRWRRSQPDIYSRFPPVTPVTSDAGRFQRWRSAGVDRIDQRRAAVKPSTARRSAEASTPAVGPLLSHRDASPPLDLAHEEQTSALALRKQHGQAPTFQWIERVSDRQ
jgi:hypothetical protein